DPRIWCRPDRHRRDRAEEGSTGAAPAVSASFDSRATQGAAQSPTASSLTHTRVWRPTAIMEQISRHLEAAETRQSTRTIESAVAGKATTKRKALDHLVKEGYVLRESGLRNSRMHSIIKPYREAED